MTDQSAASTELPINDRILRFLADATEIMKDGLQQSPMPVQTALLEQLKLGGHLSTRIEHVAGVVVLELHHDEHEIEIGRFVVEAITDPSRWIN